MRSNPRKIAENWPVDRNGIHTGYPDSYAEGVAQQSPGSRSATCRIEEPVAGLCEAGRLVLFPEKSEVTDLSYSTNGIFQRAAYPPLQPKVMP
jgi:hypothetical protein